MPPRACFALVTAVLVLTGLAVPSSASAAQGTARAVPTPGQSVYVPLEPVRLLDTRVQSARVGPAGTVDVVVTGVGGVPADATAVVLNVTGVGATATSDVRVYPVPDGDGPPPGASNLVVSPGAVVADLAVVRVGRGGAVRLRNAAGSVDLVVDLSGYFTQGAAGASYLPRAPTRLLDTRSSGGPLGPGEVRTLPVAGAAPGASAVVLNVTALGATAQTDVRVYPTRGGPPPTVSSTNPAPGRGTAALVVATVGDDGSVSLRNGAGSVQLVVDLQGAYLPDGGGAGQPGAVFHPQAPVRLLDTRVTGTPLQAGAPQTLTVAGRGAVPAQATAVALSVTAVGASRTTDLRVYPASGGNEPPFASNLLVGAGQTVANAVLAGVGEQGGVALFATGGTVHAVVDVAGWWGPPGRGWDVSWPQCTSRGATTSRLPDGGAFAIVGLTRSRPFTDNECLAAQWQWAASLPGAPSAYLNVNAPGPGTGPDSSHWADPGPRPCGGTSRDAGCGYDYGWNLVGYAVVRLPDGARPQIWLDVEDGSAWQSGSGAVAVNRAVVDGALARLAVLGYRSGIYTDRATSSAPDWRHLMGEYALPQVPNWVFRAPTADPRPLCTPASSATGGPVVMVQVQPEQSGQGFDVDDLC